MDTNIKGNNLSKPTGKIFYSDINMTDRVIINNKIDYEETTKYTLEKLINNHKPGDIISDYPKVSKHDIISKKIDLYRVTVDPIDDDTINYIKYIDDNNKYDWRYITKIIPITYYISPKNNKIFEYISSIDGYILKDYLGMQEINEEIEKFVKEKYDDKKELEKLLKINPRSYKFELGFLKKDLEKYYLYNPWQLKENYFYCYTTIIKSDENYYIIPGITEDIGICVENVKDSYCMYIGKEKDIMGTKVDINTNRLISGFFISSQNRKIVERIGNPFSYCSNYDRNVNEPEYIYCLCRVNYEDIINAEDYTLKVRKLELISPRVGYKRG